MKIVDLFDDMCYACHKIYVEEKIAELKHQPHKVTRSCFEDQSQGYFLNSSSKKEKKVWKTDGIYQEIRSWTYHY